MAGIERGAHVGEYAERLLGGPLPWTQMRAAYALISLCDKYGAGAVESVCQTALAVAKPEGPSGCPNGRAAAPHEGHG